MSSKPLFLSASRIKTSQECSWSYYAKYILKLPEDSNDGASRGWICHLIFECLGNPRHKHHYDFIIGHRDIFASKAVKELVFKHARLLNVADDDNIELIKEMTLNGLLYDFFGKNSGGGEKPAEAISEKDFEICVNKNGKKYNIKGFIDKLFLYKKKSFALIRDFKSSKQVFKGKDLDDNMQDLMYSLAVKHLYPEYLKRQSEFLFLKFDLSNDLLGKVGKGVIQMPDISNEELEGFELFLTEMQDFLENFDYDDGIANFAASQGYPSDGTFGGPLKCGKDGFKIRQGKPIVDSNGNKIKAYICPFRKPFQYYAVKDKDNKIKKTYFIKNGDKVKVDESKGEKVEILEYAGCPYWKAKKTKPVQDDFMF
jgi:hypothetical protein